jgi:hypothetical protein
MANPFHRLSVVCSGGREWATAERLAFAGSELGNQLAEMRLLDLLEPTGAVLRRIIPAIRSRAHERAHWDAVAEINPVHRDDLVDDAGEFAGGLGAFHLQRKFMAVEFVSYPLEDADKHHGLSACVLQLMKPEKHFARVKPVRATSILSAARSERLRLLFCVSERKAADSSDAVDKDGTVLIKML